MRYNSIVYNDTVNGKGMRISLFTQGCSHHCKGCFNSESWSKTGGKEFTTQTLNEIMFVFKNYKNYYDGLSLLGGDPMQNLDLCNLVVDTFRKEFGNTKDIWIWSGDTFEEIIKDKNKLGLLKKCDVLIDGEFKETLYTANLLYKGSCNQRILRIKDSLKENKIVLWKEGD